MNNLESNKSWRLFRENLIYEDLKHHLDAHDINPSMLYQIQISRLLNKLSDNIGKVQLKENN